MIMTCRMCWKRYSFNPKPGGICYTNLCYECAEPKPRHCVARPYKSRPRANALHVEGTPSDGGDDLRYASMLGANTLITPRVKATTMPDDK